jgi:hypothetical protein
MFLIENEKDGVVFFVIIILKKLTPKPVYANENGAQTEPTGL